MEDFPLIENILSKVPNKLVVNDIIQFIKTKDFNSHLFSNSKNIYPNVHIQYNNSADRIKLYDGGLGHGYYISIDYCISENKYIYCGVMDGYTSEMEIFKSENWDEVVKYVKCHMLNISYNVFTH